MGLNDQKEDVQYVIAVELDGYHLNMSILYRYVTHTHTHTHTYTHTHTHTRVGLNHPCLNCFNCSIFEVEKNL